MKRRIFDTIQIGDKSNAVSRVVDIFIVSNILLNILVAFFLTFDEMKKYFFCFRNIEIVTTLFFCVEYVLRIWTADYLYPKDSAGKARLRFLLSYNGIVDLFTILPVSFFSGFVVFRLLRVLRIFHLFRINKRYDSFNVIATVFREKRNQIYSSVVIILILMLGSSLCMYSAEHEVQPHVFKNAFSGIWWAVNTILTVGYGDIYPVTVLGKGMSIIIAFLGVGSVAIPTGIISAGFVEQYTKQANHGSKYKSADIRDVLEIKIDKDLAGKTLLEIKETEGMIPYLVLRKGLSVLPNGDLVLRRDDILIAKIEQTFRA